MTDLDYEVMEVLERYGETGNSCAVLETIYFPGCNLQYTLNELARTKTKIMGRVSVSIQDSACLKCEEVGTQTFYSLTNQGRALLTNWKRRRAERQAVEKRRMFWHYVASIVIGVTTGVMATVLCKFLGL